MARPEKLATGAIWAAQRKSKKQHSAGGLLGFELSRAPEPSSLKWLERPCRAPNAQVPGRRLRRCCHAADSGRAAGVVRGAGNVRCMSCLLPVSCCPLSQSVSSVV